MSERESHDASLRARAKIRSVFKRAWKEYYEWEGPNTRSILSIRPAPMEETKARPYPNFCPPATILATEHSSITSLDDVANCNHSVDETEGFSICQFTEDGILALEEVATGADVIALTEFAPCTDYEACAAIPANLLQGDDSDDMPFIPFADDPKFDAVEHCHEYSRFAWQVTNVDPDLNAILLETAVRLHYVYNLPIAHIDEAAVLPKTLNNYQGTCGIISISNQNDIVDWPGSSRSNYPPLLDGPAPDAGDLHSRLQSAMSIVCPKSTCQQVLCFSHNFRPVLWSLDDDRFRRELETDDDECCTETRGPCGDLCHLLHSQDARELDIAWSPSDRAQLRVLLQVAYGLPPCDIAALCRKPCREIPLMCMLLGPKGDRDIARPNYNTNSVELDAPAHNVEFAVKNISEVTPNDPCDHDGPCTAEAKCACTINKAYCTQSCRCSLRCGRRWRGCNCARKPLKHGRRSAGCLTDACPCRTANRECDPELCAPCFAPAFAPAHDDARRARGRPPRSGKGGKHTCRNSQIQLGHRKGLEVKKTGFGLGVFLTEPAKEGDLISEYTGELIFQPTFFSRGALERHRGRNYVYGLDQSFSIDGTYAGNETRFINHAPKQKANGKVAILQVNGDHRIGVFARKSIPAGAELFLDYGPEFGL